MASEFYYRANGFALAGRIEQPSETLVVQAASVLPPKGGLGAATVRDFASPTDAASFRDARTTVFGYRDDASGVHHSEVHVTIEGLNLADGFLTADTIDAALHSEHGPGSSDPDVTPSVTIKNLKIQGNLFTPRPRNILFNSMSVSALASAGATALIGPDGNAFGLASALASRPWAMTALFEPRQSGDPGVYKAGGACGLHFPNQGTVFIGDYLISSDSRRLTLLRLELEGQRAGSTITVGYLETNGHWYP